MSREYCQQCTRPRSECYCAAVVACESPIKVLIIQHPQEVQHPYNTGRMVHQCLTNSELVIAEILDNAVLDSLLQTNSTLLFPNMSWLSPIATETKAVEQLVVIDATWNKAKKILHLNPALQQLPRLALTGYPRSTYEVRKSSMPESLSTIESVVYGLESLLPDTSYQAMLQPFKQMVALAKRYQPD